MSNADARGADLRVPLPRSTALPSYDWSGVHVGGHLGYAAGVSDWSATQAGASLPNASGSLNLFETFDFFKGTGSYFGGLQLGYDHMLPSRVVLGVEADISFPNTIAGNRNFAALGIGQVDYAEHVQMSGTVRGRIGYAPNHWLYYATGGFAWSFDEFTRTQIDGSPAGGTAVPRTVESRFMAPRYGWAAGAGAEVALASNWTVRAEYLYTGYGSRSVTFPQAVQRFDSDLALHSLRLGFNYRIGDEATARTFFDKGPTALDLGNFSLHAQTTFLTQYAFPFNAPYRGRNSLLPNEGRETWDITFYAGVKLWQGAEFWLNPEIDQGFGLSSTFGVAGFPSGEAYKVGASVPYTRLPRMFLRQTVDLGGESQKVEAGPNQFSGTQTADRLVVTIGKFSVTDVFDTNKYAHDPRSDFMNWTLADTGTFDYAADAWAYTYGAAVEWYRDRWTVRAGFFDMSIAPNTTQLDPSFSQFQWLLELERRHEIFGQPGKLAVTGFLSRGRLGRYEDAIRLAQATGEPADIAAVRQFRSRSGVSFNAEQQLMPDVGMFVRAGLASGGVEPYEFTDVDRTVAAGLSLAGKRWGRPDDTLGIAGVVNTISSVHQTFLDTGGLGILVGDGQLPNPGAEKIMEIYYGFPLGSWRATLDYQFIANPAYNRDRGPVSVIGTRLHAQF
jgi:high affinity Mn2+ porin